MTNGALWQGEVGRAWAAEVRQTDRSFAPVTSALVERIGQTRPRRVLDIGCGAGELALAVARAHPQAEVAGVDISPDLIAAARDRVDAAGLTERVSFALADAGADMPPFAADLLVSRHGVMFFDDPPAAFTHLRSTAAPGAQLIFSCFRAEAENRWAADVARVIGGGTPASQAPVDSPAPGPFAFADPARVRAILGATGWRDIDLTPVDYAYVAGAGDDPVADARAFFRRIGPAARAMRELPEAERPAAEARLGDWLAEHCAGGVVSFPAAVWIVSARAG